jgi:uncharacterized protein (TIGR02594 family)
MNKAYQLALEQRGLREIPGAKHNPEVVKMFAEVGHSWVQDDETAWCAAFVGAMLKRAGMAQTGKLNARSYLDWGEPVEMSDAQPGDIVVFWRGSRDGWQGHVAFFVRWEGDGLLVVGGNQMNAVNISKYPKDRILGIRRTPHVQEPKPSVAASKDRSTPAQSTTIQATLIAFIASLGQIMGAVKSAVGEVTETFGISAEVALFIVAAACLGWVFRERLRKWAEGVR